MDTVVQKLDVTGRDIDEVALNMQREIQSMRKKGWHFSASMPVDWLLEDGLPKQYVLLVFCRRD